MISNIQQENRINQKALLLKILAGKRDTFTISKEAEEIIQTQKVGKAGKSSYEKIEASIDLQSYFEKVKIANMEAIANAGDEIVFNSKGYVSERDVCLAALTEKYSKLAAEAKASGNPEEYIMRRYNDPGCAWYVPGLTRTQINIAARYERDMLQHGEIKSGISYQDTLLKDVQLYAEPTDVSKKSLNVRW